MRIFTVIKQERIVNIRLHHVDSKLDVLICIKVYSHLSFCQVLKTRRTKKNIMGKNYWENILNPSLSLSLKLALKTHCEVIF